MPKKTYLYTSYRINTVVPRDKSYDDILQYSDLWFVTTIRAMVLRTTTFPIISTDHAHKGRSFVISKNHRQLSHQKLCGHLFAYFRHCVVNLHIPITFIIVIYELLLLLYDWSVHIMIFFYQGIVLILKFQWWSRL